METFFVQSGWCFVALAAIFGLGLIPRLAPRFYPSSPGPLVRLVAPLIFAALGAACFIGFGLEALVSIALLGSVPVIVHRWRRRKTGPPAPAPTVP
ncbi:unnamed protein product [Gemmata massiliana]|uniref:Uncharacterized protein n=1 Tax=Gemmata massiliana TaxID=1210884 RepID=A0A6P2D191_9BACT|nr:hypothetical protein [Gemmata massiliana]VTR94125.1 unnamed protein product [Gemmata massiliana]